VVVVPGSGVSPAQQTAVDRPRILVLDGQPLFVVVLSHLLSGPGLGARTLAAETTEAALEILQTDEFASGDYSTTFLEERYAAVAS